METLLVIGEGQAVQHVGTSWSEFERMAVITYGGMRVTAFSEVVIEGQIDGSRRGTLLEKRREIILGSTLFCDAEILAVARTIVEPNVAGKLGIAVDRFAEPLDDRIVPKC